VPATTYSGGGLAACLLSCPGDYAAMKGDDCSCGTSEPSASSKIVNMQCNTPCSSDERVACGGTLGHSVVKKLSPTPPVANPNDIPPEYESMGCYSDDTASRVLAYGFNADDMTPAKCAAGCPGSVYVGLQWCKWCFLLKGTSRTDMGWNADEMD
jgi:hypothetical protein